MSPAPVDFTHANADYLPAGYKYAFLFKRVYLGLYYPAFRERVIQMKARAAERGAHFYSEFGFRSWAQQHKLRLIALQGGPRAAPAGLSAHNYGLGDDSTRDADANSANGLQPTWNPKDYEILGDEASKAGLVWGASFGDRPHVNWPSFTSGAELSVLRGIWNGCPADAKDNDRLRAVWRYLDALHAAAPV